MALTRNMLKAMSIEDEKIDQIIDQHVQTVNEIKEERDRYKQEAAELPELKKRLEEAEDSSDSQELREKLEAVEKEFSEYKAGVENEQARARRENLYADLLKDAGIDSKRIKSILKVTNLDDLEINKDGTLKNADALKTKATEEWADFIVKTDTRGADTDTPPNHGGSGATMTKEEILSIKDTGERQAAIAEHLDLFGK